MNTEVGCHFLLQGILPTQGLNLCLLHWQAGSLPLSHQGSPPAQLDMGLNTENLLFLIIERTRIGQGSSDQDSDSVPLEFWFCWLTAVLYSFHGGRMTTNTSRSQHVRVTPSRTAWRFLPTTQHKSSVSLFTRCFPFHCSPGKQLGALPLPGFLRSLNQLTVKKDEISLNWFTPRVD